VTRSLLENELLLLLIGLVVFVVMRFEAVCLSDLASRPDYQLRTLNRQGWLVCILFLIPVGGVLYLLYGRPCR
jgi:hypothetical protein